MTGMGILEGIAMDFFAYLVYAEYIMYEQGELGIMPWDMRDFREWRGNL